MPPKIASGYKANDGQADSNTVTVSITITPVNDPPTITSNGGGDACGPPFRVIALSYAGGGLMVNVIAD